MIFTDILFIAIVNEAQLPLYLDPIIFYFIFDEIEFITFEDSNRHNHTIYILTISITFNNHIRSEWPDNRNRSSG